jgi:hypothetical protein
MTPIKTVVLSILLLSTYAYAEDVYSCTRVATLEDGRHAIQKDSHVGFTFSGDQVKVQLTLPNDDADKQMTFRRCFPVKQDQSNFSKWFELECRGMESIDGSAASIKRNIAGAYAGISPEVTPAYSMWDSLSATSREIGMSLPNRTFVLYSLDGSPKYEFFCYRDQKL